MRILVISLSKISRAFLKTIDSNAKIEIYSPNSSIENFACFNSYNDLQGVYTHIFLGCKPQHVEDVATHIKNISPKIYDEDTIFISVLAGTTSEKISKLFNTHKVFRIMPSLAFEFGKSFMAYFSHNIDENAVKNIERFFGSNLLIECKNEDEINYFTAIYASGIGFVFEVMDAFFANSLPFFCEENKREIVLNLFNNACRYMKYNPDLSFANATQNIASKGGTTQAGLDILRKDNMLQNAIGSAMNAIIIRAKELES